jgi:hypothetical protein
MSQSDFLGQERLNNEMKLKRRDEQQAKKGQSVKLNPH